MAHVTVQADLEREEPVMVEGLPGVGLVGKIAADHLVESLGMTYYAGIDCDGVPRIAV
ncbi:MAG: PAC2 family protein, partial [Halobacteriaceae archaeon]